MNIFILEDVLPQQIRLESAVRHILIQKNWVPKKIIIESKPLPFIEEVSRSVGNNLYFLDIELGAQEKRGLEVAQEVRQLDPFGLIVFVTSHTEFARLTFEYKVSAYDFIDKTLAKDAFETKVAACLQAHFKAAEAFHKEDTFIFDNAQSYFVVPFRDILFFETTEISRKIQLVAKNRTILFSATLDELTALDDRLFKCHRSYVINVTNILSIDKKQKLIHFSDDLTCLIARRKIGELTRRIRNYHFAFEKRVR
ncbi:hypothetical protein A5886_000351 [Enterococcus sp. 8G7_MSG3316]|uniref:HTH LytTR-type domain-containing protein n=1 Tax=Candidatus Enterococcus testudinis TaxID=1834191 RepID=A0A242A3H3_9ENTE|nr:response regulator transcription factor [Enterococcus sp. 8G7_MSG3316]OTN75281.1 hypothetical protein A5886_000351 [Enterococcus sp. 8G7_MSG3316]